MTFNPAFVNRSVDDNLDDHLLASLLRLLSPFADLTLNEEPNSIKSVQLTLDEMLITFFVIPNSEFSGGLIANYDMIADSNNIFPKKYKNGHPYILTSASVTGLSNNIAYHTRAYTNNDLLTMAFLQIRDSGTGTTDVEPATQGAFFCMMVGRIR